MNAEEKRLTRQYHAACREMKRAETRGDIRKAELLEDKVAKIVLKLGKYWK